MTIDHQLRDLGRQVRDVVALPDLDVLVDEARRRRRRRDMAGTGLAAAVLTVAGVLGMQHVVLPDASAPAGPAEQPDQGAVDVGVRPYPGPTMQTLAPGTYALRLAYGADQPHALFTVPEGWNAWLGPNHFEGVGEGPDNESAFDRTDWYVGVLVMEVREVASEPCLTVTSAGRRVRTPESLLRAVQRIPGFRVVQGPEPTTPFAAEGWHVRLLQDGPCGQHDLFRAATGNLVSGTMDGPIDLWVVDLDGRPVLVHAMTSPEVPDDARRQLDEVLASIAFVRS